MWSIYFSEQLCTLGKPQGKVNARISHWLCSNGASFGQIPMQDWMLLNSWIELLQSSEYKACNVSHAPLCSSRSMIQFLLQFFLHGPDIFNNILSRWCLLSAAENFPSVRAEVKCFMKYFAIYGYIGQCKQPFMLTNPQSYTFSFFFPRAYTI